MAKRKMKKMVEESSHCCSGSGCGWSAKEWFLALLSEGALYLFLWYVLWMLEVSVVNQWLGAFVSLVLLNVSIFACPVIRKHFL